MVKNFYPQFGFEAAGETSEGATRWRLDVNRYVPAVTYMRATEFLLGVTVQP